MIRNTPRTARVRHYCDRCRGHVAPGERYLESAASPHHGDLGNTTWWRTAECALCAKVCGRGAGL